MKTEKPKRTDNGRATTNARPFCFAMFAMFAMLRAHKQWVSAIGVFLCSMAL
jgi:hypothetical protein